MDPATQARVMEAMKAHQKPSNPMRPPPLPDPPPLPTRPETHAFKQTDLPLNIVNHIFNCLNEAFSPSNPTCTLNKQQIQALFTHVNKLKDLITHENNLEKIAKRLDKLEQRPLVTAPTLAPPSWASITNKSKSDHKNANALIRQVPTVPTNHEINEFKKASFVIRTPPGFATLDPVSASDITTKINSVLSTINATVDSQLIKVAGIARLPSKDLKIFTNTRTQAHWLLNNKHRWTNLLCSDLVTFPSRFPVILHALPTNFDPTNPLHLQELGNQNRIDSTLIQSARWLGKPVTNGKKNGSIVLQLLNKEIALKIEKSGLFLQNELYRGAHYI
ncbi:hypothetical protein PCANC_18696 [Puccinia coronata f. sp. avenae]|uniref:Uncharacterized protein n=1 Tax=Puccinia coronata f. sp. avenae TaxID=200324 RepID=A0A2N5TYV9_9BASI|nr:hypothetical protein PCANC_18696 [Puccinia coronata f. sp. avenae]PLW31632.1 hypothetical protein PCASD_17050 [Puccinia coronata f. sp. avenae]PLW34262.1 hypothetical protein PCASD_17909 [Puccinia coronata f. sp. avenae]